MQEKLWFKAKRFGWGWTPVSWEGWLVTLIWIGIIVYNFSHADKISHSSSDTLISAAPVFIVSTIIFLIICYKKGEKPGWKWGE